MGRGYHAVADRADGRRSAALARPYPAFWPTEVSRLVRSRRHREPPSPPSPPGCGSDRSRDSFTALSLLSRCSSSPALRPRSRHTDVDHGRRRARRALGRAHKECRGTGAVRESRYAVVDKTGTLTEGKPRLTAIVATEGLARMSFSNLAASLERGVSTRWQDAIVDAAAARGLTVGKAEDLRQPGRQSVTGSSMAEADHRQPPDHGRRKRRCVSPCERRPKRLRGRRSNLIFVAIDGRVGGLFAISDPIKATTPDAMRTLMNEGIPCRHAYRGQQDHCQSRRTQTGDRRSRGRSAPGSQKRNRRAPAPARTYRRHGWRRCQ